MNSALARASAPSTVRDKFNRFAFGRLKQGGNLTNQHYLDAMFSRDDLPFLKRVVDIEEPAVAMDKGLWQRCVQRRPVKNPDWHTGMG